MHSNIVYEADISFFQTSLLEWYSSNGRYFIWREKNRSNYELIIAEVFLQRTKAETVNKFLPIFFQSYPDWTKLEEATEMELQEMLRPIGLYKQRGKRLFQLAQEIKQRKGSLPTSRNQVEELSMMGQYLTNAYELYILKKKAPLLDVNMARLLERFFGKREMADIRHDPYLQTLAYRVVNVEKSKELNWAILDFAALVCKKVNPQCTTCLLIKTCTYNRLTYC
jgi:A/G-specific adenine glycosylase